MATFYRRTGGGTGFRRDAKELADFPLPPDVGERIAISNLDNPELVRSIQSETDRYAIIDGTLTLDGKPVAINPDLNRQRASAAAVQTLLTGTDPIATAFRVILADLYTQINDARELAGGGRILMPEILPRLIATAGTAAADPIPMG